MKALKVFCIILTVVTIAATGILFAMNRLTNSEVQNVTDNHESVMSTVQVVGGEYTYEIKGSESEALSETEYITFLKQAEDAFEYFAIGGGALSVLLIAGAVASGKAAKRRDAFLAAA